MDWFQATPSEDDQTSETGPPLVFPAITHILELKTTLEWKYLPAKGGDAADSYHSTPGVPVGVGVLVGLLDGVEVGVLVSEFVGVTVGVLVGDGVMVNVKVDVEVKMGE